ncbi:Ribosomal biogenesis factor [Lemmus lemmus]
MAKKIHPKPVSTNLTKTNVVNDEKENRVNRTFENISKELTHFTKGCLLGPLQKADSLVAP